MNNASTQTFKILDYHNSNITDDDIVDEMMKKSWNQKYHPDKISDICDKICKKYSGSHLKINLSDNTICDNGASSIASKLSKCPIINLDLSNNRITNQGALSLILGLKDIIINPDFEELDLFGNFVTIACKRELQNILSTSDYEKMNGKLPYF